MKIIIAGGSGFLGKALTHYFKSRGDQVVSLSRKRTHNHLYWDGQSLGHWATVLHGADVLINLAGKSVDCRYNDLNKKAILESRVASTTILNQAIECCKQPPKLFLNASTATIYQHSDTQFNTEHNGIIGDDFSMGVARAWEQAFFDTRWDHVRKVALRTSIVLGNDGGAFPKMKWITRLGMGGAQGRGRQWISWIHIQDYCRAIDHLISNHDIHGVVNVTAPQPVRNKAFMSQLRHAMNMPVGISQPVWLLELGAAILGTETELLLKSRNVYPERLLNNGFTFNYPESQQAINALLDEL